jgi:hypothetical protein
VKITFFGINAYGMRATLTMFLNIEFESQRGDRSLLGVGVRQKKLGGLISVNVYAVAAYVPLQQFKTSGAHINGNIENGLAVDKDIVIRMARHVESDVLSNALKDSLQPRVSASSLPAVDMLQVIHLKLCMRTL